jgi:hypothetical protein
VEVGYRGGAVGIKDEAGCTKDLEDDGGTKNAGVTRFVEWLIWALVWRGSGGADEAVISCVGAADEIIIGMWEEATDSVG